MAPCFHLIHPSSSYQQNSYFQLHVEFARQLRKQGKNVLAEIFEASKLRLRTIAMVFLCFISGVVPLTLSYGAASGAQNALETAVIAGMVSAIVLDVYYTPVFFA